MKIAVGCDHGGIVLKDTILQTLKDRGIDIVDCGCFEGESVDYPLYAKAVALKIANGECDRGIVMCGTGIGISIVANKFKGIRATLCGDEFTAQMSREHNNSNCLALGGRVLTQDKAKKILEIWLDTPFGGDRHQKRVDLIEQIENENFR